MPKNNNLTPATLPMKIKFSERATTKFKNNLDAIVVELISAPTIEELRSYLPQFVEATWAEHPDNAKFMNAGEKDQLIKDVFFGKTLPTALETVNLVFKIDGISLQEVTHLLRYRTASFSADCSGDKWWTDKDALVPNSIENSDEFYEAYQAIVNASKSLYCKMIDSNKISIMDARYILPRCLSTFYFMRINAKDLIHVIKQRIDKQIQPETDNVLAYRLYIELLKQYPFIAGLVDIHAPSSFYVNTARTGKATNLYFPDADSDKFEWNEKDFIYKCRRDEMNGTNEGATNKFNKVLRGVEVELGIRDADDVRLCDFLPEIEREIFSSTETPTTFEKLAASFEFDNLDMPELIEAGLCEREYTRFIKLVNSKTPVHAAVTVGSYIVSHYFELFDQFDDVCTKLSKDRFSRQVVIKFPAQHCFQSIQFLLRGEELVCIATMRSCNFKKNFLFDLAIVAGLVNELVHSIANDGLNTRSTKIIMSIGSLHIFKEDV